MPAEFVSPFEQGSLVVHATYGIGKYVGIRRLQADDGSSDDYLELEFAEGDRVFVPVAYVARLSPYVGEDAVAARLLASQQRTPYSRIKKPTAQ